MYYWNEDTLNYFKELKTLTTNKNFLLEIEKFIKTDCSLEENETTEMLQTDLLNKINK
tara:strand:- start:122 stop:295 length:174 start_codon:yes stop_codon:yes gene_type:complete